MAFAAAAALLACLALAAAILGSTPRDGNPEPVFDAQPIRAERHHLK